MPSFSRIVGQENIEDERDIRRKSWVQTTKDWIKTVKLKKHASLSEIKETESRFKLFSNLAMSKKRQYTVNSDEPKTVSIRDEPNLYTTVITTEHKTLVLHSRKIFRPVKMNLYEAFGITAKRPYVVRYRPILIVERTENGLTQRYLVPYKYSHEGRWLMNGRHVFLYMGHSFVEHRTQPNLLICIMCVNRTFGMDKEYYQCIDCEFAVRNLRGAEIPNDCPFSKILFQEMNFPYDENIEDVALPQDY